MEKKSKLEVFVSGAGKKAKGIFDSAIQSADQNDDGKFDFADVSAIAETMGNAMKKGTQAVIESAEEKARLLELKMMQPIFPFPVENAVSLVDPGFTMSRFLCVTDRDKKYTDSAVCQGSVGYISEQKDLYTVNIFRDSIDAFGVTFYPDSESDFYYVDPTNHSNYIALNDYFNYLKAVRINELKKLAQDLGAKHFRVTYKEEQTAFASKKSSLKAKATSLTTADMDRNSVEKKYSMVEIAAETSFPGHPPVTPTLKYLEKDPSIQTLVAMRMDPTSPLQHEKLVLKMSQSAGMKESDAMKIDAVLKGLKCTGNASVASEVQNESRRYLEYDIEF